MANTICDFNAFSFSLSISISLLKRFSGLFYPSSLAIFFYITFILVDVWATHSGDKFSPSFWLFLFSNLSLNSSIYSLKYVFSPWSWVLTWTIFWTSVYVGKLSTIYRYFLFFFFNLLNISTSSSCWILNYWIWIYSFLLDSWSSEFFFERVSISINVSCKFLFERYNFSWRRFRDD